MELFIVVGSYDQLVRSYDPACRDESYDPACRDGSYDPACRDGSYDQAVYTSI
jgi:hypothetical protein